MEENEGAEMKKDPQAQMQDLEGTERNEVEPGSSLKDYEKGEDNTYSNM